MPNRYCIQIKCLPFDGPVDPEVLIMIAVSLIPSTSTGLRTIRHILLLRLIINECISNSTYTKSSSIPDSSNRLLTGSELAFVPLNV